MKNVSKTNNFSKFLLVLVVSVLLTGCSSRWSSDDGLASVCAKKKVKEMLKSPSSADFASVYSQTITDLWNSTYNIKSYVDSQNSFWATARTNFSCTVSVQDSSKGCAGTIANCELN